MEPRRQKQYKKLIGLCSVCIVLLIAANLVVANILATSGNTLNDLEQRKTNLTGQNLELRSEIISQSALQTLAVRAQRLGFVSSSETLNLSAQPNVAMR
jgi:hypothetical protein